MGTRADFYVGRGVDAEWLGSIAWDGYPDGISDVVLKATTVADYRAAVAQFFSARKDVTLPEQGWPWPWNDSRTTDFAYAFAGEKVHGSCFGSAWFDPLKESEGPTNEHKKTAVFPDMTARLNVTLGPRSGLIVVGVKP